MKTFKQFMTEAHTYHPVHELMNKSQLKAVNKHPDFRTYVHSYEHPTILARTGEHHSNSIHHYVMANTGQKHSMDVTISPHGKIYYSTIHRLDKDEISGQPVWNHVKTTYAKE
jgi:hypothetical protein